MHNNILKIYTKENLETNIFEQEITYFEKSRIKGMIWSQDNKMILIYGDNGDLNVNKEIKEKLKKMKHYLFNF